MNAPRRILHVITAIDRGGAENHLLELIKHQRASGLDVTLAYLRGRGGWVPQLRELGVTVRPLALRFYGDPRPWSRLRRLLATASFDLVHAHLPPAELYLRLALLGTSHAELPLIISKHNDCSFYRGFGERTLGRWVARRASLVIAISEAVRRYIIGPQLGLPAAKVEIIRYGIDPAPFEQVAASEVAALRRAWNALPETLVVGFAGRLVEQKSIPMLLAAFALFAGRSSGDVKLVIVGEGPLEPALRKLAERQGIAHRVVWAGFREDIPAVMRALDVFALTSAHEGFGLVLLEAMAAQRPVVATRAGAIPEVVEHGITGLLSDANAPPLATCLAQLIDRDLRQRMGKASRLRVLENFTLRQMCTATDEAYARCCVTPLPGGACSAAPELAAPFAG